MLTYYTVQLIVTVINAVFSWLPAVTALPVILGIDLDLNMVQAMGQFNTVAASFWWLGDIFKGALVLLAYYGAKMVLKFFLGGRAPGNH